MPKQIPEAQILEAAVAVIVEQGFHAATTRQIAAAAGVNEVTLFRRFGSKAQLLREALRREAEAFAGALGAEPTGDLRADLVRVVRLYAEILSRRGPLVPIVLAEAARDPEMHAVFEQARRMISAVAGLLQHHQREGALRGEPPYTAVAALLGPILAGALLEHVTAAGASTPIDPIAHVQGFLDGRRP